MSDKSKLEQPIVRVSPSSGPGSPEVIGIYEPDTGSIQYVCADPATKKAALIDVVWNFDPKSYATDTSSIEQVLGLVAEKGYEVEWVLDTHPHADHFMASARLAELTGAPNAIGEKVREIAQLWRDYYNMPDAFDVDRDFSRLFADGDTFRIGDLDVRVMLSAGHTLGSITYVCGDAAFVHDTFMYPDKGTSRGDFPGGSTEELWDSLQAILELPGETRLNVGHDYGSDERDEPMWEATVAEHRANNVHMKDGTKREDYIARREKRDATLSLPERMLAALQVNLRAGKLPEAESDGHHYLKLPLNKF
ncbi:MBL fold metallo-hydrolase [Tepidamorphus sp. 3E244]|uniref:MBL fold metallo-hydrolase n=1 Tax=Tepidamorphus sp. 3E244 TaxID=3385498 RepID=UPI0038FCB4EC